LHLISSAAIGTIGFPMRIAQVGEIERRAGGMIGDGRLFFGYA